MTAVVRLEIRGEVVSIAAALEARRDPGYEWGMRRTVPSQQPAHATRVPEARKVASEWRRAHRDLLPVEVLALCDGLWATGWREERLVAIWLIGGKAVQETTPWDLLEKWSTDIDNWEHADQLADVTGRLLIADTSLLTRIKALESSANPWQRRLALVTLIVAFMKAGLYKDELRAMGDRLAKDEHPTVRRAVVWARDRLRKDHPDD